MLRAASTSLGAFALAFAFAPGRGCNTTHCTADLQASALLFTPSVTSPVHSWSSGHCAVVVEDDSSKALLAGLCVMLAICVCIIVLQIRCLHAARAEIRHLLVETRRGHDHVIKVPTPPFHATPSANVAPEPWTPMEETLTSPLPTPTLAEPLNSPPQTPAVLSSPLPTPTVASPLVTAPPPTPTVPELTPPELQQAAVDPPSQARYDAWCAGEPYETPKKLTPGRVLDESRAAAEVGRLARLSRASKGIWSNEELDAWEDRNRMEYLAVQRDKREKKVDLLLMQKKRSGSVAAAAAMFEQRVMANSA